MITRFRIIIMAGLLCHLILAASILTSQVTSQTPPSNSSNQAPSAAAPPPAATSAAPLPTSPLPAAMFPKAGEDVTFRAVEQEKEGTIYHLHGQAEIDYEDFILRADEITYHSDTGDSDLEGHVVLDGGPYDEHVESSHGAYNLKTQVGKFYGVIGTVGFRGRRSRYVLTTSNPFAFTGKIVEKNGPGHYLVRQGTVTTCQLPRPKWLFDADRFVIDVDSTAKIYNSDFRLMGIPVFYFPYVTHPVQLGRQSGLLMPSLGTSSTKGYIAGDSVYYVFNRSIDATAGAEYYSKRGWAQQGVFRMRSSEKSFLYFTYTGVVDRGIGSPPQNQGGEDARFEGEHPFAMFRGVADIDYLSSFVYRIAFTEVYTQAIDSEVRSQVFLSNTTNGFHFNALAERYQDFDVCVPVTGSNVGCSAITSTELVRVLHMPSAFVSSEEKQLGNTPLYWSFEAAAEGLQRQQVGFHTAPLVGRYDLAPALAMPLHWQGWSFEPAVVLRDTFYTQRLSPYALVAENNDLNRKSLEASVDLRPPAISKVFDKPWLGKKWKHVVEPRVRYDYVTGINNFAGIERFDYTDVLTNTNELQYSIVNRLYARGLASDTDCPTSAMANTLNVGGPPQTGSVPWELPPAPESQPCTVGPREVLSWEIGQKYFFDPTFGNALVPGVRNVLASTVDLTGVAFLNEARKFSPIVSRLRVETSPRTNTEWDVDYDPTTGQMTASTALVNYHYGPYVIGGGDALLRVLDASAGTGAPGPTNYQQFRVLAGYGQLNKLGLSAAATFGIDANEGNLQFATAQTSYNWDCCGLNIEYRRFALGAVRNENEYRFTFTLANIAAFGNLRRQERLY